MDISKDMGISMRTRLPEQEMLIAPKLLALALLCAVTVGVAAYAAAADEKSSEAAPTLRISAGDLLAVDVFDTPELSAKLRVSEKGDIDLPVAGASHVGGLTAEEAAASIEARLVAENILRHPHVEVFIQEYATQGVSVLGEVKNPGVYPELGAHTLLDFISLAGGITPTAGKAVTITHKNDPDHPTTVQLDNSPEVAKRAGVPILPGDTIVVSRSGIVYIVGDLAKPGGFLVENSDHLTALQAVALAQGANKTAALNKSKLIRKTSNGPQETRVQLAKVLSGQESDIRLEDGDILFVPTGKVRGAAYQGMSYAISLVTGLVIYRGL